MFYLEMAAPHRKSKTILAFDEQHAIDRGPQDADVFVHFVLLGCFANVVLLFHAKTAMSSKI
jgi:hypothetical protein